MSITILAIDLGKFNGVPRWFNPVLDARTLSGQRSETVPTPEPTPSRAFAARVQDLVRRRHVSRSRPIAFGNWRV